MENPKNLGNYKDVALQEYINDNRKIHVWITQKDDNNMYPQMCANEYINGISLSGMSSSKMMSHVFKFCKTRNIRDKIKIFLDVRNRKKIYEYYTLCHQLKKGQLYKLARKYEEYYVEPPEIYVFCNVFPNLSWMTYDRWNIKRINENGDIINDIMLNQ